MTLCVVPSYLVDLNLEEEVILTNWSLIIFKNICNGWKAKNNFSDDDKSCFFAMRQPHTIILPLPKDVTLQNSERRLDFDSRFQGTSLLKAFGEVWVFFRGRSANLRICSSCHSGFISIFDSFLCETWLSVCGWARAHLKRRATQTDHCSRCINQTRANNKIRDNSRLLTFSLRVYPQFCCSIQRWFFIWVDVKRHNALKSNVLLFVWQFRFLQCRIKRCLSNQLVYFQAMKTNRQTKKIKTKRIDVFLYIDMSNIFRIKNMNWLDFADVKILDWIFVKHCWCFFKGQS